MNKNDVFNRESINNSLLEIINLIGVEPSDALIEKLLELSKFKPLNSLYFYTYGSVLFHEGQIDEALKIVSNKENWWHPSPYATLLLNLMIKCFVVKNDMLKVGQYEHLLNVIDNNPQCYKFLKKSDECLKKLQESFLIGEIKPTEYSELLKEYTTQWRFVEALILYSYMEKYEIESELSCDFISFVDGFRMYESNLGYIGERLSANDGSDFIVIADESLDKIDYKVITKILKALGKNVVLIDEAVACSLDYEIDIADTIEISMDNVEICSDYMLIRPIEVYFKDEYIRNNLEILIKNLINSSDFKYYNVITNRKIFDDMSRTESLKLQVQCLSPSRGNIALKTVSFGYAGDYIEYIGKLYDMNYGDTMIRKSELAFSIVIPARNSARTLEYTLKTCLNQRGFSEKDYEIVVSDNSTEGNLEVYEMVNQFNDARIRYYRTPKNLPLNRSFEFAFSKIRGEFIIPMGSDDGILPWGLEYLRKILIQNPNDKVITWHRAFFQWSDSSNSSSAGKLVIPGIYKKDQFETIRHNTFDAILGVLINPEEYMYYLPTLYINSGFRREYLQEVYSKTGRLWDGYTQDMYMTLVNLHLNETIVVVEIPLTIAGMSDGSLGAKDVLNLKDNNEYLKLYDELKSINGFGLPIVNSYQIESCGVDTSLLVAELFRIYESVDKSSNFAKIVELIDWKIIVEKIFRKLNPVNSDYLIKLNILKDDVYKINEALGIWFEKGLYIIGTSRIYTYSPNVISEDVDYFKGFKTNSLHLDAREFNVRNVFEAAKLIENILHL